MQTDIMKREQQEGIRINKYLSEAGICSRRAADREIENGNVWINGRQAVNGDRVLPGMKVIFCGKEVHPETEEIMIAFHKPVGIVCTAEKREKQNIIDFINYPKRIYPAGPAIMSWIIEGAKKAIDKEFHTDLPDVVEAAIKAYREDNDWLGQFLEECCEMDPSYKEKSGELYQAYRAHCMQNGEYIRSTTDFYSSMDKAGFNRIRKNTGVQVVGLKLKEGQDLFIFFYGVPKHAPFFPF